MTDHTTGCAAGPATAGPAAHVRAFAVILSR